MKALFRKWLMGNNSFSAYARISVPTGIREKVYLVQNGQAIDVSGNHWLLCIEPIVYGIWIGKEEWFNYKDNNKYQLQLILPDNNAINTGEGIASLELDLMDCINERDGMLLLLTLKTS